MEVDVDRLWALYVADGTKKPSKVRDQLILAYMPLVRSIARKIREKLPSNVEFDDLVSNGTFGLIQALDRYDPSMGNKFETFAMKRISGSIYDGLRDLEWTPRSVYSENREVDVATSGLAASLQRAPTDREVASELGWEDEKVPRVRAKAAARGVRALDEPVRTRNQHDGGETSTLGDTISDKGASPQDELEMSDLQGSLATAIDCLSEKERTVLVLYYFERLKFSEISDMFEVSESRICQIHMQAIENIRGTMSG